METVNIQKTVKAWQWNGEQSGLPEGFHLCQPETNYSIGRELVYFTYAEMRPHNWITARALDDQPELDSGFTFKSVIVTTRPDETKYYREVYPFAFYEIKSEASAMRDHKAKYLDRANEAELQAFLDYATMEKWGVTENQTFELPPRLEYRVIDGGYGRGFKPYYMKPGDWLVIDGNEIKTMSDAEFKAMQK